MRNRFFFIILASLILSAAGVTSIHAYFFQNQRLLLIDRQITEISEILIHSEEFKKAIRQPRTLDETISKVLGSRRIGKIFVLRDENNKILSQNFNVALIGVEIPTHPEWATVESTNEHVRVRNIEIKESESVFQVGLVINRYFINWEIIDAQLIYFVLGVVVLLFFASVLLTFYLLEPLRILISHLRDTTSRLVDLQDLSPLPKKLHIYQNRAWARSDEFSSLVGNVQALIDRINLNYKLTRSWTFQMAHELKTPLSLLRTDLETQMKRNEISPENFRSFATEIDHMSEIIGQFLEWAEVESTRVQKHLHANKLNAVVQSLVTRLDKLSPNRLKLTVDKEFSVICNPGHLEQLLLNLLTNALKYSGNQQVLVVIKNHRLEITDLGPGIPESVKVRLGEPFNVGPDSGGGHGLGLAWVSSVAKLYGWKLTLESNGLGTRAVLLFPTEEETV